MRRTLEKLNEFIFDLKQMRESIARPRFFFVSNRLIDKKIVDDSGNSLAKQK